MELSQANSVLVERCTWINRKVIAYAIDKYVKREEKSTRLSLNKKFDRLLREKHDRDRIQTNPNRLILNLTGQEITNEQYSGLQYGLKFGVASSPREADVVASAESIWEQLIRNNCLKSGFRILARAKITFRSCAFNNLNFDDKRIIVDSTRVQTIKELQERAVILKPDKGEGIVLVSTTPTQWSLYSLIAPNSSLYLMISPHAG